VVASLAGETESQVPPLVVAAEALKVSDTGVLVTVIVCAAGTLPPCGWVKVRPVDGAGTAVILPAFTCNVT
jgi:hypothetical protein